MGVLKIVGTALLSVVALFVITKIMGHKQVAQLDFFDYVSGITIGSIGAELATDLEQPWQALVALAVYGCVSVFLSLLTHKFPRMRKYINGSPTILMNDGIIYRDNLKKAKLDLSEFMLLCREQGFFNLEEIQTVVFEQNGKLSVLPRPAGRPVTPTDLKIPAKATHPSVEVVMDGRVMGENLARMGYNTDWLYEQLKTHGYSCIRDVLLAVYSREEDRMTVYPNC